MMNKFKSAVTSPVFWIALVSGVILATAFSAVRRIAKPVASQIPKNDAA
jgi:hypothetical protein